MVEYKMSGFLPEELLQAARIQIRELPQGFLSSLGEKPLALIFKHVATSRYGILILAKEREYGNVIGYVFGATNTGKMYKDFLVKHLFEAIFYFLPKLLSLQRIKKAVETLCYPTRKKENGDDKCAAELLDLAVTEAYHGKGVGRNLFLNFTKLCVAHGVGCFDIPTSEGLSRAHRFYEKNGATRITTVEVHNSQQTFIYRYVVNKHEGAMF